MGVSHVTGHPGSRPHGRGFWEWVLTESDIQPVMAKIGEQVVGSPKPA